MLRRAPYRENIAVSYTYTVDNELDFGKVFPKTNFLNHYNDKVYNKDENGKVTLINDRVNITIDLAESQRQVEVDFGELEFPENVYVTILDNSVLSTSAINCTMSIGSDRDADEMEFCSFTCSVVNVTDGVSYQVLVTDSFRQAEGKYLLNTTRL